MTTAHAIEVSASAKNQGRTALRECGANGVSPNRVFEVHKTRRQVDVVETVDYGSISFRARKDVSALVCQDEELCSDHLPISEADMQEIDPFAHPPLCRSTAKRQFPATSRDLLISENKFRCDGCLALEQAGDGSLLGNLG